MYLKKNHDRREIKRDKIIAEKLEYLSGTLKRDSKYF